MAAGATHGLAFRLPAPRAEASAPRRDRVFEAWRASIWSAGTVGAFTLVTTALNVIAGPADEIVMASACTLTGVLGQVAPRPE
jgi:hypothetical protein